MSQLFWESQRNQVKVKLKVYSDEVVQTKFKLTTTIAIQSLPFQTFAS